jgi:lipid A 3-O-deacylase
MRSFPFTAAFFVFAVSSALLIHAQTRQVASENNEWNAESRPWQVGFFAQGGFPPAYKSYIDSNFYLKPGLQLYSAGLEFGKETRWRDGPRLLRGRGEAMLEVIPFWLARYPRSELVFYQVGGPVETIPGLSLPARNFSGASVTPFLLRWNFSDRKPGRIVPWAQLGGGLLWTNHKFPPSSLYPYIGDTSVINFTPQVGFGANVFTHGRHSFNFAMKVIHISNASLGDQNPGLNATLQFSAGYSWWRR